MSEAQAPSHPLRHAALVGLAGSATATVLAGVVHTLVPPVPFPPVSIAQRLVGTTSGQIESFFISHLGHWAERITIIGASATYVLSGAIVGVILARLSGTARRMPERLWYVCLLPVWLVSVVAYQAAPQFLGRWAFAAVTLPIYLVGGTVAAWTDRRLHAPPTPTDESRRVFIRSVGFGTAGAVLGASGVGAMLFARPDPGGRMLHVPSLEPLPTPSGTAGDEAFEHIPGLTTEITPIGSFYVVDESFVDPDIDPASWRLQVNGLVQRPMQLSYPALKRLPAVERYQTLECISNHVGGHLMSTARWVGVPLKEILDRAGVDASRAVEVVFRAAGGYSDSLSIDQAMDDSTLVAIGMNGHVLPRAHGFPARLLSIGTYGMKNPKWLTSIEVVDRPYQGYWEQRGWTKRAIVRSGSRVDVPTDGAVVGRAATIAGVAFSGDRGISRVEVSTDNGRTWSDAQLKTALGPLTWRLWRYRWTPIRPGRFGIVARAYEGDGRLQSGAHRPPYPSGASGYDEIEVTR
ncbi:MAG: molybdopterin-dependent oxidoreductase [Actinomycetota bacterium]